MSAAKDKPVSQPATDAYRDNYDRIFGKKAKEATLALKLSAKQIAEEAAVEILNREFNTKKSSE